MDAAFRQSWPTAENAARRIAFVVVAAGSGQRAGGPIPKQFQDLGGQTILTRTLRACLAHPAVGAVVTVIHPDFRPAYDAAVAPLNDSRLLPPAPGGPTRQASVYEGLLALEPLAPDEVLIHDAARPFLSVEVISRLSDALLRHPAAFPALPVVDALWRAEGGLANAPTPRSDLWRAQTPQAFRFAQILAAHRAHQGTASDDVAVAHASGLDVGIVLGDGNNFKITLPEDFTRAARLLESTMDIRTGQGFDVHAFATGNHVTLCGVDIPFDKSLKGHSDADVAMHAITDALFGALAEGDIGRWFPPSEPEWEGAQSDIFLRKAMERVATRGFGVTNIDCTIICEAPKIGPHADAMRDKLAEITGVAADRISVKATTSEQLGFTGRGEGIAAMATATLVGS